MNSLTDVAAALNAHLRRVQTLESAMDLLGWDEQVNMPPGGADIEPKGGSVAYAWFVFARDHNGPPTLGWLP